MYIVSSYPYNIHNVETVGRGSTWHTCTFFNQYYNNFECRHSLTSPFHVLSMKTFTGFTLITAKCSAYRDPQQLYAGEESVNEIHTEGEIVIYFDGKRGASLG